MTDQEALIRAAEFIEAHREPTRWLLEGLLPEVGIATISGGSNSGKTWVGLELAIDFASGQTFLRQSFEDKGAVLILCAGDNLQAIAERIMALCRGKGFEVPKDIYFDQNLMDFNDGSSVEAFRKILQRTGCKLVIIDNFRQYLPKMAEYSGYCVGISLRALRKACEQEGICCVILQQNERTYHAKEGRYSRPSRGVSALFGQCDVVMDLSEESGARTLAVVKNRLGELQKKFRFGVFSEVGGQGEELSHLILLEEPGEVTRQTHIAEHAKLQMKRFLIAHKGEQFGRKDLIEALGAVMPLPRQRNLDEAFAELGKDLYVTSIFKGKEKFYSWQDESVGYKEEPKEDWELDPNADPIEMAKQLEEMGREVVRMARRATGKD